MHESVDENEQPLTEKQKLLQIRSNLIGNYRATIQTATRALDYYMRFRKVEDWEEDSVQEYIDILKKDSKRFIKEVALDISRIRKRLDMINNQLMDISRT